VEELQTVFLARQEELGVEATAVATRRQAQTAVGQLLDERPWSLVCSPDLSWPSIEERRTEHTAAADFGLVQARWAIAESGTIAVDTADGEHRATSLLPPAVGFFLPLSRLVPRLGDLLEKLVETRDSLPACITMITGPSASADIVGVRVVGVHGPGEVHVWLIEDE
jgi:L-lactate utilization protein LutC